MQNIVEKPMSTDFSDVSINGTLMSQCKDCGTIVMNGDFPKRKHCKSMCPKKMMFKVSRNMVGSSMIVTCLVCNVVYSVNSLEFMGIHRENCKKPQQSEVAQRQPKLHLQTQIQPTPATMAHNNATTQNEPQSNHSRSAQTSKTPLRKIAPNLNQSQSSQKSGAPLQSIANFKISSVIQSIEPTDSSKGVDTPATTRLPTQNGPSPLVQNKMIIVDLNDFQYNPKRGILRNGGSIRLIECRICKKVLLLKMALYHRSSCKGNANNQQASNVTQKEPMVLFSVQTTPTEKEIERENNSPNSIDKANLSPQINDCPDKSCFVCGSDDSRSLVNMGDIVSVQSKRNIVEFVWEFLNKASVRTDAVDASGLKQNVICGSCVTLINKFDAAYEVAMEFKNKLTNNLTEMEAKHAQAQSEENIQTEDLNGAQQEGMEQIEIIDLCDD